MNLAAELDRRAWVEQIMGLPVSVHLRGPRVRTDPVGGTGGAGLRRAAGGRRGVQHVPAGQRAGRLGARRARRRPRRRRRCARWWTLCDGPGCGPTGGSTPRGLPTPAPAARFDPSGLVKGWAVERAAGIWPTCPTATTLPQRRRGRAAWTAPGGTAWRVGVEDPARPRAVLDVLERRAARSPPRAPRTAARTSSTRAPAGPPTSCGRSPWSGPTCSGPTCTRPRPSPGAPDALDWLDTLDGYAGLLVDTSGRVRATPNWPGTRPAAQTRAG